MNELIFVLVIVAAIGALVIGTAKATWYLMHFPRERLGFMSGKIEESIMHSTLALKFLGALALLTGIAIVGAAYWESRDNGRFVYHTSGSQLTVLDSRTGAVYLYTSRKDGKEGTDISFIEVNPSTGRAVERHVWYPQAK